MFVSVMEVKAGLPCELLYNDYLVLVAKSEEEQKDSKVKRVYRYLAYESKCGKDQSYDKWMQRGRIG
jgi:hypothetical protein